MADHIDIDDRAFEEYPTEAWDLERLKETCFICQPALFLRRRVVEQHGLPDESLHYCMDYEYWLRLGKQGRIFTIWSRSWPDRGSTARTRRWGRGWRCTARSTT